MFCINCGEKVPDGAVFCPACGARTWSPDDPAETGAGPAGSETDAWPWAGNAETDTWSAGGAGTSGDSAAAGGAWSAGSGSDGSGVNTGGAWSGPGVAGSAGSPTGGPTPPTQPFQPYTQAAAGSASASKGKAPYVAAIVVLAVALVAVLALLVLPNLDGCTHSEDTAVEEQDADDAEADADGDADADDDADDADDTSSQTAAEAKEPATLEVSQVDNSAFPQVTLYVRMTDSTGVSLTSIEASQITVTEVSSSGSSYTATVEEAARLAAGDDMSVNLVLDQSGSMNSSSKMDQAKEAADAFIDVLAEYSGTQAEVTSFDDAVYNCQPFTSDVTLLKSAVDSLVPNGQTALNDALYWALQRTNLKSGSRVVIAFTDGIENASNYSQADVIELSRLTGIPVYIIGVGDDVDRADLRSFATSCNGGYFDAAASGLASTLESIYESIYADQRSLIRVVFTSTFTAETEEYRTVRVAYAESSAYSGSCETTYMPVDNVPEYDNSASSNDYVLAQSSSRYYTREELEKLSLWELYLARNEIFARYGRGFKNQDLVEYFATRSWYTQLYTPEEFDAMTSPLNDYERANTELMLTIEKERSSPYLTTSK